MQLSEIMVKASQAPHHLLLPQHNKQVVSSDLCQMYYFMESNIRTGATQFIASGHLPSVKLD